ncbi:hypothetical protein ACFX13_019318 [Malus domestica]
MGLGATLAVKSTLSLFIITSLSKGELDLAPNRRLGTKFGTKGMTRPLCPTILSAIVLAILDMAGATCSDLVASFFCPLGKSQVNHKPIGSRRTNSSSERSLLFFLSRHLLSKQRRSIFPPSVAARSTTVIGRASASTLILFTSSFGSSPRFS